MTTKKLTDLKCRAAKPSEGNEKLLSDGEGLHLRVRPNGKDWMFIFSHAGKRRKMGLGSYPDVTLESARAKSRMARSQVAEGHDPVRARKNSLKETIAAQTAVEARLTVEGLFQHWFTRVLSAQADKGAEARRAFAKDVLPHVGDRYADEIKRRDVMELLDIVKARNSPRMTNVLLQRLRQMFRYAAVREIVAADPTLGIAKKDAGGPTKKRDRHLSQAEISKLWTLLPAAKLPFSAERAIWIILSTLCRIGELTGARWSDFDIKRGEWRIPREIAKNRKEHLVHLSPFAIAELNALRLRCESSKWLYPTSDPSADESRDGATIQAQIYERQRVVPIKGRTKAVTSLVLPGGRWTCHDLRRTGATLMGELRVRSDVIERCLNHQSDNELQVVYQRQELFQERKDAFLCLGERLGILQTGGEGLALGGLIESR